MDRDPLGAASENGHTEVVQLLLEAGSIVSHQDKVSIIHSIIRCYL